VDVTAVDDNGNPVTDLKQNEIEIYENGQKQKITGFNFVSNVSETIEQPKNDKNAIPVPLPGHTLRPEQIHRTFALVVDDLSLSFESAYYTRRALRKFVDGQMQDGDLVAIIRTGAGIGALQQFTSDKRVLYAAIEKVKWNPNGTGGVTAFAPISTEPQDPADAAAAAGQDPSGDQSLDDFRTSVFATGTLGALKYIVTGMGQLPGRKSVILFSDGFKLFETDADGVQTEGRVMDFLKVLVDAANRATVTFYTIDPRGLQYTGLTAADSIGDTSSDSINQAIQSRSDQLHDTQDGLRYLAKETGGFAVVNSNDLSGGVKRVLQDQSYYLVAYEPEGDTFDPTKRKFNQLAVKVLRPHVHVRYRSGFFNVTDPDKAVATAPDARSGVRQLQDALLSPFGVRGIYLRMNAVFGDDPKLGPFVRSLLHINAKDLNFNDDKNGGKKITIELLAMAFGDNGQVVDQLGRGYDLTVNPAKLQDLLRDGFVFQFMFPIKKPGAYQFRVAIRDATGGSVGSASQFIQVPDLKKRGLTVSSIVIQNVTADEWRNIASGGANSVSSASSDTALRRISGGSVLRYGYEIYNAKLDASRKPDLTTRVRVFREGKLFYEGKDTPVAIAGQTDLGHIKNAGAIAIGKQMDPGDYVLQVVVTDSLAKAKQQIATQFIEFEVVQ
jgi:VWFA-related protein